MENKEKIEELYERIWQLEKEKMELEEKNGKAIEFIEGFIKEDYYEKLDEYITHFTWNKEKGDLLEILKGENNEN